MPTTIALHWIVNQVPVPITSLISASDRPTPRPSSSPRTTFCAGNTIEQPQEQASELATTKTAKMSQSTINSSSLSTVPENYPAATPPTSSPASSQHLPEAKADTPTPATESTASLTSATSTTSKPANPPQSPTPHAPGMVEKRASTPPVKRGREDDAQEDSPPSKKATTSKAKAKAKPAPETAAKSTPRKPAVKKATPPPRQPSSRPSRNRKAPERFEDLQEVKTPKELPVKKSVGKVFDPVYITTNSGSRLGKADVYHMLLEESAWSSLSSEQQATLVSMLPPTPPNTSLLTAIKNGETDGRRPQAFDKSNDCFRTDVAKFQEDLRNGHLAKTWQAAAEQAVIERAEGKYDAWKAGGFVAIVVTRLGPGCGNCES